MTRERRLRVAIGLNAAIIAVQVAAGFAANSIGLLADAAHNLIDVAAVFLSLVAVRLARRSPTASKSFGWHRSTILAAQANAALLLGATGVIGVEAVRRLIHPAAVRPGIVAVVAGAAAVLNLAAALAVHEHDADLNMRSAMVHLAGDAGVSLGVAVAGVAMIIAGGLRRLDPAVSLVIGAVILYQGVALLREATDVLLESTPPGLDLADLARAMAAVAGVEDVHDLHVWSLSSEIRALSAHLVLAGHPSLEEAQAIGEVVKGRIGSDFAIAHATLELECETCVVPDIDPCAIEVPAAIDAPAIDAPPIDAPDGAGA